MMNLALTMMNLALTMMNLVFKMMNLALKMMNLAFKMMSFVLKMMIAVLKDAVNQTQCRMETVSNIRSRSVFYVFGKDREFPMARMASFLKVWCISRIDNRIVERLDTTRQVLFLADFSETMMDLRWKWWIMRAENDGFALKMMDFCNAAPSRSLTKRRVWSFWTCVCSLKTMNSTRTMTGLCWHNMIILRWKWRLLLTKWWFYITNKVLRDGEVRMRWRMMDLKWI